MPGPQFHKDQYCTQRQTACGPEGFLRNALAHCGKNPARYVLDRIKSESHPPRSFWVYQAPQFHLRPRAPPRLHVKRLQPNEVVPKTPFLDLHSRQLFAFKKVNSFRNLGLLSS